MGTWTQWTGKPYVRQMQRGAVALAVAGMLAACGGNDDDGQPLDVTILHINDHHSHLDEEASSSVNALKFKFETAPGKREDIAVSAGGFARVAALINSKSKTAVNPIKIHAGDALTGTLYYTQTKGEADAALMNFVGFDTLTLGNHEFDDGDAALKGFLERLTKTVTLSANVNFGASSPLKGSSLVKPYTIIEKEGQRIGLIGLTVAGKTKESSRPNADTVFEDEVIAAQRAIDELAKQGVNKIIVQSHYGYDNDKALANKLSGVDVIVGGDSHTLLAPEKLADYGFTPAGDYPTKVKDKSGADVCIVQAYQYSVVVGELSVKFDKDGKVASCAGVPHILIGEDFKRTSSPAAALTATELASIKADVVNSKTFAVVAPDQAAQNVLAPFAAKKAELEKTVVTTVSQNLCLRRVPGVNIDKNRSKLSGCNPTENALIDGHVNAHGGDVQQLVAEAFLHQGKAFFKADLSIQNGGGVRVDVNSGDLTVAKIYEVLPFTNVLVHLKVTGQEIKNALEDSIDFMMKNPGANTGTYPYSAGLRWNVDLTKARGARLSELQLRQPDGSYAAFDLNKTYNLATTDFLADGKDGYTTLGTIKGDRRSDVGLSYASVLLNYAQALKAEGKAVTRLPTVDYSTQKFTE